MEDHIRVNGKMIEWTDMVNFFILVAKLLIKATGQRISLMVQVVSLTKSTKFLWVGCQLTILIFLILKINGNSTRDNSIMILGKAREWLNLELDSLFMVFLRMMLLMEKVLFIKIMEMSFKELGKITFSLQFDKCIT